MVSFIRKHKFDIILIGALCIITLTIFLIFELTKSKGNYVSVVIDGKEVATYSLNTDGQYKLGNEEEYNTLVIENGSAYISKASCPDKLCVNQGKISYNNEQLVCLPNNTIISLISKTEPETDF